MTNIPNQAQRMKIIGILGGSSDQATADYYRLLNKGMNARLGGWNTAEIIISSMNFAMSEHFVRNDLWDDCGAYLADKAQGLERAGADFILCVSNTLHRVADRFMTGIDIPFLHIADPTARAIQAAGLKRVALLGTRPVMATDDMKRRYRDQFGIDILVPDEADQIATDRIIFDELCRGLFTPASKAAYLDLIDRLVMQGAEGVILGCTEIPLLIEQADRPQVPMFNTLALHVEAALDLALRDVAIKQG
ncbi:aspartate/glutamate racemase family protein [Govanella unica]|uniref:Aspartate/glutamate racemase family protein n=1 Tax=Govanella unica TaxID=2975056 RepID=A0A9X3TZG8_9PROT|nr:aspartate/glutamate racemase family protein [Govania unica]MDA5194594.1 aspartate/glutamate racemase family protein [Govania unica]